MDITVGPVPISSTRLCPEFSTKHINRLDCGGWIQCSTVQCSAVQGKERFTFGFQLGEEIMEVAQKESNFFIQVAVVSFDVNVGMKSFFIKFLQLSVTLHRIHFPTLYKEINLIGWQFLLMLSRRHYHATNERVSKTRISRYCAPSIQLRLTTLI